MRNPHGYVTVVDPTGDVPMAEYDTTTCRHCQTITIIGAGKDPASYGGFCRVCMSLICGPCADKGTCTPWEKQLEQVEARAESRRSLGI